MPALLIKISNVPRRATAATSSSLVTSSCTGVTCSELSDSRSSGLRVPATTSAAPAPINAVTSARPRPRLAPVTTTRLPSISMRIPSHSRELIQPCANNAPNEYQFNAGQRLSIDPLTERLGPQHLSVLTQLDQDHDRHRND